MPASRLLPTDEAVDLIAPGPRPRRPASCAPLVAAAERDGEFPREVFRTLGRAGLLGLPYPEEYGGGGLALRGLPAGARGDRRRLGERRRRRQRARPVLLRAGDRAAPRSRSSAGCPTCSAASCSAPTASPSRTPAPTRPRCAPGRGRDGDEYVINGAKAWTTHGGHADFYKVMARTGDGRNGISCFLVPADADRPGRRPARAQDGPDRLDHRDDALRRRPGAGRATGSARRARASRSRSPASTPAGSASPRSPPASPRAPSTTRSPTPRARDLRRADHRPPGAGLPAGRHGGGRRDRPGDDAARGPAQGPGPARSAARPRSPSWSPPTTR